MSHLLKTQTKAVSSAMPYTPAQSCLLRRSPTNQAEPSEVPPIVHEALRSPGEPLDPTTRAFMDLRFGHDFSQVRVHTDGKAAESARAVNALAYTVGRDVVFGAGEYAQGSANGRRLLAHELTHVVQQRGPKPMVQKQTAMEAGGDTFEEEAERVGTLVAESEITGEEEPESELTDKSSISKSKSSKKKTPKKPKPPPNPCTRTILAEGTCEDLVLGSAYRCCDPKNGIENPDRTKDNEGKSCPDKKFTPMFTCDIDCDGALKKGCDDNDNWMAIPAKGKTKKEKFSYVKARCGEEYTICANGKQKKGYVRDGSVTEKSYEVSPGIQKALGVNVGDSFKGAVYRPGAKQETIDKDPCCKT